MVKKQRYAILYGEFENEMKKDKHYFHLSEQGFKPPDFYKFSCP